ncbi:MAG: hypothetical protein ACKOYM_02355, partial [Actinomycetes bacterium]
TPPNSSNVNYGRNATVANLTVTAIGTNGQITITASGGCPHVIVDIAGTTTPDPLGTPTGPIAVRPNPVVISSLPGTAPITVYWNGQAPNRLIFVDICRRSSTDGAFVLALDCAPYAEVVVTGTTTGSGSTTLDAFRGPEASGDLPWGCFAPGDAAPPRVEKVTTCFVRVTSDVALNAADAVEQAFTIASQ